MSAPVVPQSKDLPFALAAIKAENSKSGTVAGKSRFYLPQLDGLRSIAFLLVFSSHAGAIAPNASFPWLINWLAEMVVHVKRLSSSGVDLFFVLSAFLITSLLVREEQKFSSIDTPRFLCRRALRIWPLYFLAVFVGLLVFPFICQAPPAQFGTRDYRHFVECVGLWSATFSLNIGTALLIVCPPANLAPLWSISMEEQFYLVWPFLLKVCKSRSSRMFLLGALLCTTVAARWHFMQAFPSNHIVYYENTLSRLDPILFGAGIAFATTIYPKISRAFSKLGLVWFGTAMVLLEISGSQSVRFFSEHNCFALTINDLGWAFFLMAALWFSPLAKVLATKHLVGFGRLTYGMYVIHAFVLQTIARYICSPFGLVPETNAWALCNWTLGLPVTFLLAAFLWHAYEKHFYNLKAHFARISSGFTS